MTKKLYGEKREYRVLISYFVIMKSMNTCMSNIDLVNNGIIFAKIHPVKWMCIWKNLRKIYCNITSRFWIVRNELQCPRNVCFMIGYLWMKSGLSGIIIFVKVWNILHIHCKPIIDLIKRLIMKYTKCMFCFGTLNTVYRSHKLCP